MRPYVALLLLIGCDEEVDVANVPPRVTATQYCRDADRLFIDIDVKDHERDAVDVELTADTGRGARRLPGGSTGSGRSGLASERETGRRHRLEWGTAFEVSTGCGRGTCRLQPCASGGCEAQCDAAGPENCVDNCAALPPALGDVEGCAERGAAAPTTLEVTVLATDDGDRVTADTATLVLRDGCAP